jgi:hypothetical protein
MTACTTTKTDVTKGRIESRIGSSTRWALGSQTPRRLLPKCPPGAGASGSTFTPHPNRTHGTRASAVDPRGELRAENPCLRTRRPNH